MTYKQNLTSLARRI